MEAVFVELPAFERNRARYLTDDGFAALQQALMIRPDGGDLMPGAGGLRKFRFTDARRGKGVRGGLRVIYYHWPAGGQFWLFTLYDKGEVSDLTDAQRRMLKAALKAELGARRTHA